MAEKESHEASLETNKDAKQEKILIKGRVYKGIPMVNNEAELIGTMDIRPNDIWVCSFPRSGTTLTQELTYLIRTLDFKKALSTQLDERFPMIDIKDDRFPYYKGIKYVEEMSSPRFIKCHLPFFLLPQQLQEGKGKIIYIARNPKDVVTSFYRFMLWGDGLDDIENRFDKFVQMFVKGEVYYGYWPKHVLGFWEKRSSSANMLFLKYEDLIKDTKNGCRQIAEFLGRELSDDEVDRICNHCHVDSMRSNDMVNLSYWRNIIKPIDNAGGGFMNKGKAGAWKDLLAPAVVERLDSMIKELEGSGLDIKDE
ncbi:ST1A1-like protein [Mya arenaria]|uniref:ST1A1-like protein n=1 Tax=Mya arenaria TaxID=6604 RepID=A0ABY7D9V6_MYAAR|nr:sulfotransferase 4A1-like [Mya arenaria]WAQ94068.1 ST1A1-like protein [Mya arenaria]